MVTQKVMEWLLRPAALWFLLLTYTTMGFWVMPRATAKIEPYNQGLQLLDMELAARQGDPFSVDKFRLTFKHFAPSGI